LQSDKLKVSTRIKVFWDTRGRKINLWWGPRSLLHPRPCTLQETLEHREIPIRILPKYVENKLKKTWHVGALNIASLFVINRLLWQLEQIANLGTPENRGP